MTPTPPRVPPSAASPEPQPQPQPGSQAQPQPQPGSQAQPQPQPRSLSDSAAGASSPTSPSPRSSSPERQPRPALSRPEQPQPARARPALSRATVDRDAATRDDPAALDAAWKDARVLVVDQAQALVLEEDRPRLVLVDSADAPEGERFYLGRDHDGPVFAVAADVGRKLGARKLGLRDVGALLDDRDAGLLTHAVGLANWHATHRRCPRCGAPTEPVRGGSVRRCTEDGSDHFPRTDPAVIMLVHDGADRCVLGRQAVWPAGRFSTLAGFVEPGESAEQAVVREVAEETGIACWGVEYVDSQPWPFPASLMLGFTAQCDPEAVPHPADGELEEVRWFTREELRDAPVWGGRGAGVQLPSPVSIAWLLITGWIARG